MPSRREASAGGEEQGGIQPRYRRAFGCVTWIYMATLAFLAAVFVLLTPFWFFGGWSVFSIFEGYALFATAAFLPAMGLGALLGARTYRSERRVATRNGTVVGAILGWLGYASIVWLEVNQEREGASLYLLIFLFAVAAVLIVYALFTADAERGRRFAAVSAIVAAASGIAVLALDGDGLVIAGALVSTIAGAAAGWVGGFGYARAGGKEMAGEDR